MIVDFHTHILPEQIVKDPKGFAMRDDYFGFLSMATPANHTKQLFATYKEAAQQMDKDGVDKIVIQGWPFLSHEYCVMQNDYVLEAMKAYPDRIIGFCVVNPNDGINAHGEVKRCIQAGMAGVGELDPYGQSFSLGDDSFLKICDLCMDFHIPISLHISEPVGAFYFGKSDVPLNDYVNLVMAKPLLKVILAHWGGGLPFYELMPEISKAFTNVYYDTAASPLICSPQVYMSTINLVGHRKILFGTGYPLLLYPQSGKQADFITMINEIRTQIQFKEALDDILGKNALRLLGLLKEGGEKTCPYPMLDRGE
ncbi:MAG: amidohydrolase family protein [Clostridia bacterium]|nr:amidohydrolase family protein [Clostridia bacterium]